MGRATCRSYKWRWQKHFSLKCFDRSNGFGISVVHLLVAHSGEWRWGTKPSRMPKPVWTRRMDQFQLTLGKPHCPGLSASYSAFLFARFSVCRLFKLCFGCTVKVTWDLSCGRFIKTFNQKVKQEREMISMNFYFPISFIFVHFRHNVLRYQFAFTISVDWAAIWHPLCSKPTWSAGNAAG